MAALVSWAAAVVQRKVQHEEGGFSKQVVYSGPVWQSSDESSWINGFLIEEIGGMSGGRGQGLQAPL